MNKELTTASIAAALEDLAILDSYGNTLKTVKCVSRRFKDVAGIGARMPMVVVVSGRQGSIKEMGGDSARPYDTTFYVDIYGVIESSDSGDTMTNYFLQAIDDVVSPMIYDAEALPKVWSGRAISFGNGDDVLSKFGLSTIPGRLCKITYELQTMVA